VLAVGTRLADFTTGSRALFPAGIPLVQLNVQPFDAVKHGSLPLVGDARRSLELLDDGLAEWRASSAWQERAAELRQGWARAVDAATAASNTELPSDGQVLGAVNRRVPRDAIVVGAAGGLPAELHKLWRTGAVGGYHLEYGYSTMGYEIAGALGVKLAQPRREVVVLLGDGSYLMMNSEIATSLMLGLKLTIVVLDNRGFGCIDRLQRACGGASFNNLLETVETRVTLPPVDFAAQSRSMGADAVQVAGLADLELAINRALASPHTSVVVINTDPRASTAAGGAWWDVAVPEVSARQEVQQARERYEAARRRQALA
jgi:3D-(3,5/4)-trihydroxycyclohexane-1,2-dione acylhydrolase (decyclizing)